MFIETVPNRNSPPAVLLRRSFRRNGKTVKQTLANLTHWPPNVVAGLERLLQGKTLVAFDDVFAVERTVAHGHVAAVLGTLRRLGVDALIASRRCRERDLVVAMIAERLLHPCSNSGARPPANARRVTAGHREGVGENSARGLAADPNAVDER